MIHLTDPCVVQVKWMISVLLPAVLSGPVEKHPHLTRRIAGRSTSVFVSYFRSNR